MSTEQEMMAEIMNVALVPLSPCFPPGPWNEDRKVHQLYTQEKIRTPQPTHGGAPEFCSNTEAHCGSDAEGQQDLYSPYPFDEMTVEELADLSDIEFSLGGDWSLDFVDEVSFSDNELMSTDTDDEASFYCDDEETCSIAFHLPVVEERSVIVPIRSLGSPDMRLRING